MTRDEAKHLVDYARADLERLSSPNREKHQAALDAYAAAVRELVLTELSGEQNGELAGERDTELEDAEQSMREEAIEVEKIIGYPGGRCRAIMIEIDRLRAENAALRGAT